MKGFRRELEGGKEGTVERKWHLKGQGKISFDFAAAAAAASFGEIEN